MIAVLFPWEHCFAETPDNHLRISPAFVAGMANDYADRHSKTDDDKNWISWLYIAGFFSSYVAGGDHALTPHKGEHSQMLNAMEHGMHAGSLHRSKHPDSIHRVMTGFGYKEVTLSGTWTTASSMSRLRTNDIEVSYAGVWVSQSFTSVRGLTWYPTPRPPGIKESKYVDAAFIKATLGKSTDVTITGYLSPKGKHGHLGSFERNIYPTSVVPIKP